MAVAPARRLQSFDASGVSGYTMNPMRANHDEFPYPRRRLARAFLRQLVRGTFWLFSDFQIEGRNNLPAGGPLIVVANHFHFADPPVLIRTLPWPLEFIGASRFVDAPPTMAWLPRLWGYYAVHRGAVSGHAMRAAQAVLSQKGVLGIFPEGGSWATVLRPARLGAALLAVETGAPILPLGIDGMTHMFPLSMRRRPPVTVRIGPVFGPYTANGRGRGRRAELEAIGADMMRHVQALLPPERHGVFSADPNLRAAAEAVAVWPFDDEDKRGW